MNDIAYWLALYRAPGVGPTTFQALLDHFGSAQAVVESRQCASSGLLGKASLDYLADPDWSAVEKDMVWLEEPDHHALTLTDPRYPTLLREIADPPPLLFVVGDPGVLSAMHLAIVGSRNPTAAGKETAEEFAAHLAGAGLVITSGLAVGIDAAAHRGALAARGATLAVTGTGLDRVYPARHRELAHQIAEQGGALVSEFVLGTPPLPDHFPRRNRIISGLSLGTLVVEAAVQSGSLITARTAVEQGREVFAIPGSIHSPLARGCHALIRQGAKLVETAQDILEELNPLAHTVKAAASVGEPGNDMSELDVEAAKLLGCMGYEPSSVDVLIARSGLTPEKVSSILLLLELRGYVAAMPGGLYTQRGKRA
jgi:DNA processing protein